MLNVATLYYQSTSNISLQLDIKMSNDPASYIEGVPVKISEKYRPPRRVNLSLSFLHSIDTDVLTTEYDLAVENETLKWLQDMKNHKENKIQLREEKIRQYEEQKEKKKEERLHQQKLEEEKQKSRECEQNTNEENENKETVEESKEENVNEDESEEEVGKTPSTDDPCVCLEVETPAKEGNVSEKGQPVLMTTDVSSSFLKKEINNYNNSGNNPTAFFPANCHQSSYSTPVLIPTQCPTQKCNEKSPTKTDFSNINFAEFENDGDDPFDSVALKSINDMEELAKILQATSIKQQKIDPSLSNVGFSGYQQPGTYVNGGYQYNPYLYANYPQSTPPINTSLYNQILSYPTEVPTSNTSMPLPSKNNSIYPQDSYSHANYSLWNTLSSNSNHTVKAQVQKFEPYNYAIPQTPLPSNVAMDNAPPTGGLSGFPTIPTVTQSSNPMINSPIQTLDSGIDLVNKRPDLEDFYTRYYSNKKSPSSKTRSGASTPTSIQQTCKTTLSSSSSVPDLTAVEDSDVLNIVTGDNHERLHPQQLPGNSSSRPRPCSTEGYELMTRPFPSPSKPSSSARQKLQLPDPFTELTEDAQSLVQNMAEMGFPRSRVARAVQKLGTDHKKLLEVLLTLQSFQENGEDEVRSERAFYYFMGEVERVREFLQASKALMDLGFEEEQVVEGLFKHQNDRERCLEELIG